MQLVNADIWRLFDDGYDVVITTNIGWDSRRFSNNMGAGTALQAYERYPSLPIWYGHECSRMAHSDSVDVLYRGDLRLYFFPVKPLLDPRDPERSWDQLASYELIERMLARFAAMPRPRKAALTLPGAGNGGLDPERVRALVLQQLGNASDVTLCDLQL